MNNDQVQRLRKRMGLNQTEFWEKVGVSQSAGSRYETGATAIPRPIVLLLKLTFKKGK